MENYKTALGSVWVLLGTTCFNKHPNLGKVTVIFAVVLIAYVLFSKLQSNLKK